MRLLLPPIRLFITCYQLIITANFQNETTCSYKHLHVWQSGGEIIIRSAFPIWSDSPCWWGSRWHSGLALLMTVTAWIKAGVLLWKTRGLFPATCSLPEPLRKSAPLTESWQLSIFALCWTSLCSQDSSVKHFGWFCNEKTWYYRASSYCHRRVLERIGSDLQPSHKEWDL